MKCDPERLSHYRDGELSPEQAHQLRAHLAECSRCAERLDQYDLIEQSVRRLSRDLPPRDLRRAVYQRVEERRRLRRRAWSTHRLKLPVVTTATMALVAAGAVTGLPNLAAGAPPVMTAAFAVQERPDSLDGLRLELVFDRPVASDSLVEGISIQPPLPIQQRVQENKVELIPRDELSPHSSYRLVVSNVRDVRGHSQLAPVVLTLVAGPSPMLVQESSPAELPLEREASAGSMELDGPRPAEVGRGPTASAISADAAEGVQRDANGEQLVRSRLTTLALGPGRPPEAQPGLENARGLSLAPLAAAARPLDTDFRPVLGALPELRRQLGLVGGPERLVHLGEQSFQGGAMLARADSNEVLVLIRSTGRWSSYANGWRPGEVLGPVGSRPPGTLEPLRGFGKVWRDQPSVKLQLGWAVYEERSAEASVQRFERGTLMRSAHGVLYALFDDGSWRTLIDPTR
jgi:hypothetical protein